MSSVEVVKEEFPGENVGEFGDVIEAICRVREIIGTASKLTDETAKQSLLDGAKIVLGQCIEAIDTRKPEPTVIEDDNDD